MLKIHCSGVEWRKRGETCRVQYLQKWQNVVEDKRLGRRGIERASYGCVGLVVPVLGGEACCLLLKVRAGTGEECSSCHCSLYVLPAAVCDTDARLNSVHAV